MATRSISFEDDILTWAQKKAKEARRPLSNYINWMLLKEKKKEEEPQNAG